MGVVLLKLTRRSQRSNDAHTHTVQAICITKGLPSEKWAVLHDSPREEPWGRARLIIQKKVA